MKAKNGIEVLIDGNKYTLCGYESAEYLQKIATYLNGKHEEVRKTVNSRLMSSDTQSILIEINVADDYFKTLAKLEELTKEKEEADRALFELKHDLVATQDKLEKLKRKNI